MPVVPGILCLMPVKFEVSLHESIRELTVAIAFEAGVGSWPTTSPSVAPSTVPPTSAPTVDDVTQVTNATGSSSDDHLFTILLGVGFGLAFMGPIVMICLRKRDSERKSLTG